MERTVKEGMFPHPERRGDQSGQRGSLRVHSDQFVEGKAERPAQMVAPRALPSVWCASLGQAGGDGC